jgi:hypothetical protein
MRATAEETLMGMFFAGGRVDAARERADLLRFRKNTSRGITPMHNSQYGVSN